MCRKLFLYVLAVCVLCAAGCVRVPAARSARRAVPLASELRAEISYPPHAFTVASERVREANPEYVVFDVTLSLSCTNLLTESSLRLEHYVPARDGKAPVVVILPVSGGRYFVEHYFARRFAERGYAAVIVYREKGAKPTNGEETNHLLKESIIRNRLVLDWIETRPELDAKRIGVLGTSMGAIKGALLLCADSRVRRAVLGLGGGDVPYILAYSTEGAWRGGGIVKYRERYLKERRMTRAEFQRGLEKTITWDPLRLAPAVDPAEVFLVLGLCDTVVPFKKGLELRHALGHPATLFLPTGHYSSVLFLPQIWKAAFLFFNKEFKE